MRLLPTLLVVSLAANVGLLAALAVRSPAAVRSRVPIRERSGPSRDESVSGSLAASSNRLAAGPAGDTLRWDRLYTDDLAEFTRRLRAAGFPPVMVRAAVMELIGERFAPRFRELTGPPRETAYWKVEPSPYDNPEWRKLSEERGRLIRSVLGFDLLSGQTGALATYRRRYGDLSDEKIRALGSLEFNYSEQRSRIFQGAQGDASPSSLILSEVSALERKQEADIAALLTPEEYLGYQMRSGPVALGLRATLTAFQGTESEYRGLWQIYQACYERASQTAADPASQSTAMKAALEQAREQIKAVLGPDRYADYLQSTDPGSKKLNSIVSRLGLPLSAATQVAGVQKDITGRADEIRADATLTAEQRSSRLAALADEAESRIATTLGQRGLGAYKQYSGRWLQTLGSGAPRRK